MFKFTHETYSGPLDVLLQLIEESKLNITEVSLSRVTDEYIKYVQSSGHVYEGEMADFLLIAAKLLYMKSKLLLPIQLPEEESAVDLARQLKMYEQYVRAAEELKEILLRRHFMYAREPITIKATGFQPPKTLSARRMGAVMEDIAHRFKPKLLEEVEVRRVMSIKEKIDAVQDMLTTFKRGKFKDFIADPSSRADVIVTFLALLELVKQRTISVQQDTHFDHIHIEATI